MEKDILYKKVLSVRTKTEINERFIDALAKQRMDRMRKIYRLEDKKDGNE